MKNTNEEEASHKADYEGMNSPICNLQRAYLLMDLAIAKCNSARLNWSENEYDVSKKWMGLAIEKLGTARGRITQQQAQIAMQDDAENKCEWNIGGGWGLLKCGLPSTHKLVGGGLFYCEKHAEAMGKHVEKI